MRSLSEAYSIDKELHHDERIIWKGRPARGFKLRGTDVFLIPFSLFWTGFAITWEFTAITQVHSDPLIGFIFPLFGIPFVLVGLYIVFGRFILDAKNRKKTEYAITDQRVIIKSGLFSRKTKSIRLGALPEISFTEKKDNSGTIIFGESNLPRGSIRGFYWPGMPDVSAFEMIDNVRKVHEMIQTSPVR